MTEWEPATEAEAAMRDALRVTDQELYFRILARTELLLPVSPDALAGRAPFGWGTWNSGGRTHVLAFTSAEAMRVCLAEHSGSARKIAYHELAGAWPNEDWWLAVNPGLPIEGYLPPWFVTQLARGDVRMPDRPGSPLSRTSRADPTPDSIVEPIGHAADEPANAHHGGRARAASFTRGTTAAAATGARREAARATATAPRSAFTPTPPPTPEEPLEAEMVDTEPPYARATGAHSAHKTVTSANRPDGRRPKRHDATIIDAEIISSTVMGAAALEAMVVNATVIDASKIDSEVIEATLVSVHETGTRRVRAEHANGDRPHVGVAEPSRPRRADATEDVDTSPTRVINTAAMADESMTQRIDPRDAARIAGPTRHVDLFGNEDNGATRGRPRHQAGEGDESATRRIDRSPGRYDESATRRIDVPADATDAERTRRINLHRAADHAAPPDGATTLGRDADALGADDSMTRRIGLFGNGEADTVGPPPPGGWSAATTVRGNRGRAYDDAVDAFAADAATTAAFIGDTGEQDVNAQQPHGPAQQEPDGPVFIPANDTERDLLEAASGGKTEQFLSTLLLARVLVPLPDGVPSDVQLDDDLFPWRRDEVDGQPYLVVFTSSERMTEFLGDGVVSINAKFIQLIHVWPDVKWAFAINPGSPVGATLPGIQIKALAAWADDAGLTDDEGLGEYDDAAAAAPASNMPVVMQKPIAASQVDYYLERGYDRASGFVHRATEVMHLQTPAQLVGTLGLTYSGSPFRRDASEIYLLRWAAYRPDLYRIPYGGQHEAAMRAMQGWMIERAPFRGNGFAPAENGEVIAEFKVDSIRLPHGAQMWRVTSDGRKTLIALLDADEGLWRPVHGIDSEAVWDPSVPIVPPTPSVEGPKRTASGRASISDPLDDPLDPRWRGSGRRGPRSPNGVAPNGVDARARARER
ncbi:MAG TPA: SseB family protein [Micromonosporaceae bacterium]|nr:SseB family protein [Micromonosporaceae bacterium]